MQKPHTNSKAYPLHAKGDLLDIDSLHLKTDTEFVFDVDSIYLNIDTELDSECVDNNNNSLNKLNKLSSDISAIILQYIPDERMKSLYSLQLSIFDKVQFILLI